MPSSHVYVGAPMTRNNLFREVTGGRQCINGHESDTPYCPTCGKVVRQKKSSVPNEKFQAWALANDFESAKEAWESLQEGDGDDPTFFMCEGNSYVGFVLAEGDLEILGEWPIDPLDLSRKTVDLKSLCAAWGYEGLEPTLFLVHA